MLFVVVLDDLRFLIFLAAIGKRSNVDLHDPLNFVMAVLIRIICFASHVFLQ